MVGSRKGRTRGGQNRQIARTDANGECKLEGPRGDKLIPKKDVVEDTGEETRGKVRTTLVRLGTQESGPR